MTSQESALLIIAKLALADGRIDEAEREFLTLLLEQSPSELRIDDLLKAAPKAELAELVGKVEKYEDRFFIALRAYLMAHVDWEYDRQEESLYGSLVKLLAIEAEDLELIKQTEIDLRSPEPKEPAPRVQELYERSSFFRPEGPGPAA